MRILSNATLYTAVLPPAAALADSLVKYPHGPIPDGRATLNAFVPVTPGNLVQSIPGGYAFLWRQDQKILPKLVIDEAVAARVARDYFEPPGRKALRELRERVMYELLATAPYRTRKVPCFYYEGNGTLLVGSPSAGVCDAVMHDLIHALSPTPFAASFFAPEWLPSTMSMMAAGYCDLSPLQLDGFFGFESADGKATALIKRDLPPSDEVIQEAFRSGLKLRALGLRSEDGQVAFRLRDDMALTGIHFAQSEEPQPWPLEAGAQLRLLIEAINDIQKWAPETE